VATTTINYPTPNPPKPESVTITLSVEETKQLRNFARFLRKANSCDYDQQQRVIAKSGNWYAVFMDEYRTYPLLDSYIFGPFADEVADL
jgi:hypothetical protein